MRVNGDRRWSVKLQFVRVGVWLEGHVLLGHHEAVSCPECAGGLFHFFISVLLSTRGQISLIEFSKLPFGDYSAMLLRIILPLHAKRQRLLCKIGRYSLV